MEKKRLRVDFAGAIASFLAVIKSIELKIKQYKILFRGKGLDFEGYREYSQDDDAGDIDWKATVRSGGTPMVRVYREERDLNFIFVIDVGENMIFGSKDKLKCEFMGEVIAAMMHLMFLAGDRVGILLFSDRIVKYIPPSKGENFFFQVMDVLTEPNNYGAHSKPEVAFDYIKKHFDNRIKGIFLFSDFIRFREKFESEIALLANMFETIAIMIKDPVDRQLPDVYMEMVIRDPATGQRILINPKLARGAYSKFAAEQETTVKGLFGHVGVDILELDTDKPFALPLATFLRERVRGGLRTR
jgi:uncharacterized protein (DUF58 family)